MKVSFKFGMKGHSSGVYCLHDAQEEMKFYSGSADGVVAMWDLTSGKSAPLSIQGTPDTVLQMLVQTAYTQSTKVLILVPGQATLNPR